METEDLIAILFYGGFGGGFVLLVFFYLWKRFQDSKKENYEKRDN